MRRRLKSWMLTGSLRSWSQNPRPLQHLLARLSKPGPTEDQLYRLAPSAGVQRDQVLNARRVSGAARGTHQIEAEIATANGADSTSGAAGSGIGGGAGESLDVKPAYLKRFREIVDLEVICKAKLHVCLAPMWGAARGYSDTLLRAGVKVATVHDDRSVLFGGHAPEPDDPLLRGGGTLWVSN